MKRIPIVILHRPNGEMIDTWHRLVYSGPVEHWPRDSDKFYSRMMPEPCDDAPDGCRLRYLHVGVCRPTPEEVNERWWPTVLQEEED